jgi:hypothetical protein
VVATKTPVATAMTGGQTTINSQLKVAAAMATKMTRMKATMMTTKAKVTALPLAAAA